MDFIRFTGEWVIYYALIALGGAVLLGLTVAVLTPIASRAIEDGAGLGPCLGGGGCRGRRGLAGRGEEERHREHRAGAHRDLHAAVRGHAVRFGHRLHGRRDRARVRPGTC